MLTYLCTAIQCACDSPQETFYNPCIPVCARSCDHKYEVSTGCDKTCVEGCDYEPCSPGYIWKNETVYECIPEEDCRPFCSVYNGVTYRENDRITDPAIVDECQTWWVIMWIVQKHC